MGLFDKVANVATIGLWDKITNPGSTRQAQVPLETPEQRAARLKLSDFTNTGKFNNYTAGEDIGITPGNFDITNLEKAGQSELIKLITSGIPEQFRLGDEALASFLNPDPNYISSQFDPFKAQVERQIRDSDTDLRRAAGFAGSLYSTDTISRLGDIRARANETLTSQLASLTNEALNRRLQAIPLAYDSATAQEGILRGRIADTQDFGGLSRELDNARIADKNAEILRRRNEMLLPINVASSIAGTNANFGVPEVTVQNQNPVLDLLSAVISGGSRIAAARAGRK